MKGIIILYWSLFLVGFADSFVPSRLGSRSQWTRILATTELETTTDVGDQTNAPNVKSSPQEEPDSKKTAELVSTTTNPALLEDENFQCDETVEFWRNFQSDGFSSAQENVQNIARIALQFARNPDAADY